MQNEVHAYASLFRTYNLSVYQKCQEGHADFDICTSLLQLQSYNM
jgi:hypothetical protein